MAFRVHHTDSEDWDRVLVLVLVLESDGSEDWGWVLVQVGGSGDWDWVLIQKTEPLEELNRAPLPSRSVVCHPGLLAERSQPQALRCAC